jgi:hypothetical protein
MGTQGAFDMRTKILIVCLAAGFLGLGQSGQAAGNRAIAGKHSASFQSKYHARQAHRSATISEQTVSAVIPRAIRGGNPLQMFNPLAPAKYRTAEDNVALDPDVAGKGSGINLFSISF